MKAKIPDWQPNAYGIDEDYIPWDESASGPSDEWYDLELTDNNEE